MVFLFGRIFLSKVLNWQKIHSQLQYKMSIYEMPLLYKSSTTQSWLQHDEMERCYFSCCNREDALSADRGMAGQMYIFNPPVQMGPLICITFHLSVGL